MRFSHSQTPCKVAALVVPPTPHTMLDFLKLDELRQQHDRKLSAYRDVTRRAREALAEVAQLRAATTIAPASQQVKMQTLLNLPVKEMLAQDAATLAAAGVDARTLQLIVSAERRAANLKNEAATLAPQVHASAALLARLETYASRA